MRRPATMADPDDSPPAPEPAATPARARRSVLKSGLYALGFVVLAAIALVVAVAGSLDRPFVKDRIRRLVRDQVGIAIDYDRTRLRLFSGIEIGGLRIASPAPYDAIEPELVRVRKIDVGWSLGAVLGRHTIESVELHGVQVNVVMRAGDDSISALLRARPKSAGAPSKPEPLSQMLAALPPELPVRSVHVDGVTLTLDRRGPAPDPIDQFRLDGLALAVRAGGPGVRTLELSLGTARAPIELHLVRQGGAGGEVRARLALELSAQDRRIAAVLALELETQSFDRSLPPIAKLLALSAEVRPDPAAHRTEVEVRALDAADGALSSTATIALPDGSAPIVERAEGAIDLGRMVRALPAAWTGLALASGSVRVRAEDLVLAAPGTGTLHLDGALDGLRLARAGREIAIDGAKLVLDGHAAAGAIGALALETRLKSLTIRDRGKTLIAKAPARLTLRANDLLPDVARPIASRGKLRAALDLDGARLTAQADKRADDADFQIAVDAQRLGMVAALLGPAALGGYRIPWAKMGLTLASKGTLRRIASRAPALTQSSTIDLTSPALASHGQALAAARLHLALDSDGTQSAERAHLALAVARLSMGGQPRGDGQLAGTVSFDLDRPKASVDLRGSGSAGPAGTIALAAEWDRARRAVRYRGDVELSKLALVESLLPEAVRAHHHLSWSKIEVGLHAEGEVRGAVVGFRAGARPILAREPLRAARGHDQVDLRVSGLRYRGDDGLVASVPTLVTHSTVSADGERRTIDSHVEIDRLHAVVGGDRIDAVKLAPDFTLALSGDPLRGEGTLTLHLSAQSIRDSASELYPLGGVALEARVSRTAEGDVRFEELRFDNQAGGTQLSAEGGLDLTADAATAPDQPKKRGATLRERLIAGRRSLALSGTLTQDLAALRGGPAGLKAGGKLGLRFQVRSGDLKLFHTSGTLSLDGAQLALAGSHLDLEGVNALLPITQDLLIDDDGQVTRLGGVDVNAYPRLRFADQHPFLSKESFLKLAQLRLGTLTLGPLAGNARIDRNLFALDQLELYAGGGKVTGQCLVDLTPGDTTVTFRGAVTGLRPSGQDDGERLDANAALTLSLDRRSLEGRAELIRIGRHHLLDLLDLYDPYHADVAANRVRLALKVGYPKSVRLAFSQGFASLQIALGGIARLVRIDEIRGVPVGPLIEKYLGPLLPKGTP